jgi:branched-chain amino acid transport system substrate-binding protein
MIKPRKIVVVFALIALAASACGGNSSGGTIGGGSGGKLVIGVDLPMQGASKDASEATVNAMKLYLDQVGHKAGNHEVDLKVYDDSTAAKGAWDDATCAKNAQDHVATPGEVAVMGTYNSGCAKIQVPVLNSDPTGPMLMMSHASTNPGLTKPWDPGEPDKFYPSGARNFGRVIGTDDYQGVAAAQFAAKDLGAKRCYVLNDNQTYGQGVARVFADEAPKQGITVLGNTPWDPKQPNYSALFTSIKAQNPDCIYLAGIFDNNGGQLVKDKVRALGDNNAVKLMVPDGFSGYPEFDNLAEAQGAYLTFAGLTSESLRKNGGAGAKLLDAYKQKYGSDPASSYALYGVQALQVMLEAIAKSDGSRKGVRDQVFSGAGISIPADKAAVGKAIQVNPQTGDVSVRDISVMQVKNNQETLVKPWQLN